MAVTLIESDTPIAAFGEAIPPPYDPQYLLCPSSAQVGDTLVINLAYLFFGGGERLPIPDWAIFPPAAPLQSSWTPLVSHQFLGVADGGAPTYPYRSQWLYLRITANDLGKSWRFEQPEQGAPFTVDALTFWLFRGAAGAPQVYLKNIALNSPQDFSGNSGSVLSDSIPNVVLGDRVMVERRLKAIGPVSLTVSPSAIIEQLPIGADQQNFSVSTTFSFPTFSGAASIAGKVQLLHLVSADRTATFSPALPPPTFDLVGNPETRASFNATLPAPSFALVGSKFASATARNVMRRPAQDRRLRREKQYRVLRRAPSGDS